MSKKQETLELEEVPVLFMNFSASPTKYNATGGVISFSAVIEDLDQADLLLSEQWALKPLKDEEGDVTAYHLPIKVNFDSLYPPRVYRVSEGHRAKISKTRDTVYVLDSMRVIFADVSVNKYHWSVSGNSGVKAYLDTAYFVVQETNLDLKWDQIFDGTPDEIEANFEALVKDKMADK